jgi:serine/threonine protein kinase
MASVDNREISKSDLVTSFKPKISFAFKEK